MHTLADSNGEGDRMRESERQEDGAGQNRVRERESDWEAASVGPKYLIGNRREMCIADRKPQGGREGERGRRSGREAEEEEESERSTGGSRSSE